MAIDTAISTESRRTVDAGREAVADARSGLEDTLGTVRARAEELGDRLPGVVGAVRIGAAEGARTVRGWPEPTQELVASFSLGLGIGLTLAGAPRLIVAATLLPAIAVAASTIGRDHRADVERASRPR
jgi:hypothetical protein